MHLPVIRTVLAAGLLICCAWTHCVRAEQRALTLDDLFNLSVLKSTAVSPNGEWIAAVVIRPVRSGEVYGRTSYDKDVSRADIWLISRRTGEKRDLTQGAADASGFWCAAWSPDGERLAMLSTKPEGSEPRGGDNVHLYIWDMKQERMARLSPRPIMTQNPGGLARIDMRGRYADSGARCSDDENAPFLWLSSDSLLAITLPEGSVSAIVDEYGRALRHASQTRDRLRTGLEPTVTAVESGGEAPALKTASLQIFDLARSTAWDVATIPAYPFEGTVQVMAAPNGRAAAVLATLGPIPPGESHRFAYPFVSWAVRNTLGFIDLIPDSPVRWLRDSPPDSRYILDLLSWAPDGSAVAIRARSTPAAKAQALFVVSAHDLSVTRVSPPGISVMASPAGAGITGDSTVLWTDGGRLLARAIRAEEELSPFEWYRRQYSRERLPRADWWLFAPGVNAVNLTADMRSVPASLRASMAPGEFVGAADGVLWSVNIHSRKAIAFATQQLPEGSEAIWPRSQQPTSELVLAGREGPNGRPLMRVRLRNGGAVATKLRLPSATARLESYAAQHSFMLFLDRAPTGTFLWETVPGNSKTEKRLALNEHLADAMFGRRMLITYRGSDGDELKAGVILPPDYQPGRKYPVFVWVYAGMMLRDVTDHPLDIYKPGQYNLHLYAARGYVVLIPSMPLRPDGGKNDDHIELPKGVLPAIDRLIDLGIADRERVAVMGQSYGGFSTYSLITYTNRFKAAIALAGMTDLVSVYGQFDPTARSYSGIEHQKSVNWAIAEQGQISMGVPPWEDLWHYLRNSPLYFVDRVQTPLLLIHGEQDVRGSMAQAEEFFYSLFRQGKRARLLRYWGEDHGLRLSPANVRNIFEEVLGWLEMNMPARTESSLRPNGKAEDAVVVPAT